MDYPLGHEDRELKRLDRQADLLGFPGLAQIVRGKTHLLEVGCGKGSNVKVVRALNPEIKITGVDLSREALTIAQQQWGDKKTDFREMDLQKVSEGFPENSFDTLLVRLVFWSIGDLWTKSLPGLSRVMKPQGHIYIYEPNDHGLKLGPRKAAAMKLVHRWQSVMVARNKNPFVGEELEVGLMTAGFKDVKIQKLLIRSDGKDPAHYRQTAQNIWGIYSRLSRLDLDLTQEEWDLAREEFLRNPDSEDFIEEVYIVAIGSKMD